MNRGLSIYLDALRLAAALQVFVFHLSGFRFTGVEKASWNAYGHEAVVVFFVLSGFVICHAASTRDRTIEDFVTSRLTRIYSVALPCLALTLLFDLVGRTLAPSVYEGLTPSGSPLIRLAIGAAMLNESWVSVQMLSNTPYWSIAYEFWYYALFAALFYLSGWRRLLAAVAVALIAGLKILLLAPIWAMGWAAYRETMSSRLGIWASAILFVQPALVLFAYDHWNLSAESARILQTALGYETWRNGLSWSRFVLGDTLLGLSVALHIVGAKNIAPRLRFGLDRLAQPIKFGADRSFTLYVLHQPAILFVAACSGGLNLGDLRPYIIAVVVLGLVAIVALLTEGQRHRLKPPVRRIVDAISQLLGRATSVLLARRTV